MTTHRPTTSRQHRQRGLAVVEMAIVLPLLAMMLVATAELGRAAYQYNTLTKAIRDGAQYAAQNVLIPGTGVMSLTAGVKAATQNLVVYGNPAGTGDSLLPGFVAANVTVTAADATHIQVSATYGYIPIFGSIPGFGYGADITPASTLNASTVMRAL